MSHCTGPIPVGSPAFQRTLSEPAATGAIDALGCSVGAGGVDATDEVGVGVGVVVGVGVGRGDVDALDGVSITAVPVVHATTIIAPNNEATHSPHHESLTPRSCFDIRQR